MTIDPRDVPAAAQIETLKRIKLTMETYPPHAQFCIIAQTVLAALAQSQKEAKKS